MDEYIILSEVCQTQNDKYFSTWSNEKKFLETEWRLVHNTINVINATELCT